MILCCIWIKAKDPALAKTKHDLVFVALVIIPEICLYIYGYTFIFSPEQEFCKQNTKSIYKLWISVLIFLIYGMFFILFCIGVLIFACGVYYIYSSWSAHPQNDRDSNLTLTVMEKLPLVGLVL